MILRDEKYAVFLDIDGTVMGRNMEALRRNLDVIQKVRSLGHKVYINTGRSTAYLPKEIDTNKFFDGVISGAGARIIMDGEEVFFRPMDIETVKAFCVYCENIENVSILEGVDDMYFVGPQKELDYTWDCIFAENMSDYVNENLKIEKFTVLGTAPGKLKEVLGEEYVIIQHQIYAEIIRKGVTKSGAMKFVLDKLGLPVEQSIAMGDSLNDFDMIEAAGIGVAMGNAIEEIKEISTMTTNHVDKAGVAEALIKLFSL